MIHGSNGEWCCKLELFGATATSICPRGIIWALVQLQDSGYANASLLVVFFCMHPSLMYNQCLFNIAPNFTIDNRSIHVLNKSTNYITSLIHAAASPRGWASTHIGKAFIHHALFRVLLKVITVLQRAHNGQLN